MPECAALCLTEDLGTGSEWGPIVSSLIKHKQTLGSSVLVNDLGP